MTDKKGIKGRPPAFVRMVMLAAVILVILLSVFMIRQFIHKESSYSDSLAEQITQEMEDNRLLLSSGMGHRTAVEFEDPIILAHSHETKLIVHEATLSETISISREGLGGWDWTSAYQNIEYTGVAQYTVDLSRLGDDDFTVNNELKQLTVRIPYAELTMLDIPNDEIKFGDTVRGWAAAREITMTAEQSSQLTAQVTARMKAKLIDEDEIAAANSEAKEVVAALLSATVAAVDPEFTVVVVQ